MSAPTHVRSASLKWRIIGLAFSAVAGLSVAFCAATYVVVSKYFDRQSTAEIHARIGAIDNMLETAGARQLDAAKIFARNPAVVALAAAHDGAAASALAGELGRALEFGGIVIFNADGSVLGRSAAEAGAGPESPGVKAALGGRSGHGFVPADGSSSTPRRRSQTTGGLSAASW